MTLSSRSRLLAGSAALALGTLSLAGCGSGSQHAADGDTGAAAPATTIDMSATRNVGDSTTGLTPQTGTAAPAGTTDTTKRVSSPTAQPGPSTAGTSTPKQ